MPEEIKEGRPLKFKTVKELEDKIQAYFDSCFKWEWEVEKVKDAEGNPVLVRADVGQGMIEKTQNVKVRKQIKPVTVTGLAYALDTSRKVLLEYQEKEEFSNTITRAKQYIESLIEEKGMAGEGNANFIIFNLKNNYGWKDEFHNVNRDSNLTEEQKKKLDEMLLIKNDKPNSA